MRGSGVLLGVGGGGWDCPKSAGGVCQREEEEEEEEEERSSDSTCAGQHPLSLADR